MISSTEYVNLERRVMRKVKNVRESLGEERTVREKQIRETISWLECVTSLAHTHTAKL